ncbi:MAG TPA: diguanylate cyclase [Pseudomonadales bacterium]
MTNAALQDTDDKDWRRKYTDVVRTLETDERRYREQEQTLKRLVRQLCLAGSGQSEAIDAALQRVRDLLAQEPMAHAELHGAGSAVADAVMQQERRQPSETGPIAVGPASSAASDNAAEGSSAAASGASDTHTALAFDPLVRDALSRLLAELRRDAELTRAADELNDDLCKATIADELPALVQRTCVMAVQRIRTLETLRSGLETLLDQMVGRLDEMSAWIAGDAAALRQQMSRREDFGRQVQSEVSAIGASADAANDLAQLRTVLRTRLDSFGQRLEEFRKREDDHQRAALEKSAQMHARIAELESETGKLQQKIQEEKRNALLDPLTQVANRLGWDQRIADEVERWRQYPQPTCVATWDIDHFKRINDTYGHTAGDKVLRIVAQALAKQLRSSDFIARYGGEEFVMIVPGTSLANGTALANKIRETVSRIGFHFSGNPVVITISCGITELRAGDDAGSVFERADQALYRAKEDGRNCVVNV